MIHVGDGLLDVPLSGSITPVVFKQSQKETHCVQAVSKYAKKKKARKERKEKRERKGKKEREKEREEERTIAGLSYGFIRGGLLGQ